MANRKINELSVRTPSLTDLMIVGDPSTGYSFKATLAALNTLIDSSTSIGDLNGVVITSPTNGQALVYDGTNWVNQSISVPVTSVFGRTGAVVATEGDYSLDLLSDVTLTTPSSNQVLQYNGTAWVNATLTDNGITSLNGLTALSQTFATGTSGTDFAISSTTSTHTFNLPTASAVNRGALSSADWSTFNAKQNAITLTTTGSSGSATLVGATLNIPTYTLSGLGGISGSGTSGQVAYWTGTSSQSGSNNLFWDNANGRLGIGTNAPATKIQVSAEGSEEGAYIDRYVSISAASAPVILLRRARGSISSPSALLNGDTIGVFGFRGYGTTAFGAGSRAGIGALAGENWTDTAQGALFGMFTTANGSTTASYKLQIFGNGNTVLQNGGTFIDGGQRLQVNGDALIKGSGNTSGTTALTVQNSDATNLMTIRNDGLTTISTGSGSVQVSRSGNLFSIDRASLRVLNDGVNPVFAVFPTIGSRTVAETNNIVTTGMTVNPTSGPTVYNMYSVLPTINQTGGANGITRGLYVNPTLTAAADWRSIEWSNNSGWGLYGDGSARNFLRGNLHIGTASSNTTSALLLIKNITGATSVNHTLNFSSIQSDVTLSANIFVSYPSTQAASFTLTTLNHFWAIQQTFGAGSSVTNQYGFHAGDLLVGATNNFGFYGNIPSGTGRWNLYMNGTAANYMNGNLLLGSTTDGGQKLQVTGNVSITGNITQSLGTTSTLGTINFASSNGTIQSTTSLNIITGVSGRLDITKSAAITSTSGTITLLRVGSEAGQFRAFAPTSGTATYTVQDIAAEINQTGGANGITRGLYINPTLTSAADWRSLEWSNNTGKGIWGVGTADNAMAGSLTVGAASSANASAILELSSTTKALLLPRMTGAQAEAIAGVDGLVIYANNGNGTTITSTGFWGYAAGAWVKLN